MFLTLAETIEAEPLYLMSIVKPVLMLAVIGPWAWLAGRLDKDAEFYFLKREQWGMAHIGAGLMALLVMVMVPVFWAGLALGVVILAGETYAYVHFRNKEVPEKAKWSGMDIIRKIEDERKTKAATKATAESDVKFIDKDGVPMKVPIGNDPRVPAFELFSNLLSFAVPRKSDRLEIVVDAAKAVFSARVDGIRYPQDAPQPELCIQLIDYLKENAGMDTSDRRRKQTGRMGVEVEGIRHELELTTAGSTKALQLILEIDPEERMEIPLKHLGLLPRQLAQLSTLTEQTDKVVIFSSPPHTGVTTTTYAMLQLHDPYTTSVMTYERETPFAVEGVSHNLFPEGASNDQIMEQFAALMRGDPNVMLVSQVISTDMAKLIAMQAEDCRTYLPLPAKDTLSALKLWIKLVGDKQLAADSVAAIVSQRLVRKLCATCRAPYEPDEAAMKKLNMPKTGGHLYKASGKVMIKNKEEDCPTCYGMGYTGRVGVYEIMFLDDEARALIAKGDGEGLRMHLRKAHMVYLQEAALAKVVEGVSDIKEVTRIMSEHQKG